jgi:hypothetical protein
MTFLIVVGVLLVLQAIPAVMRPAEFLQDDSYFYLQIGRNIAAGHGSTFHGLTPTNGYHPLWMPAVTAAAWLTDADSTATLRLVIAIQLALTLATALIFLRLARDMSLTHGLLGLAVLLAYLLGTGVYGSEAHLNALTSTAAILALWHSLGSERAAAWLGTGMLFGLAILARLDNLFVAACLLGFGVLHDQPQRLAPVASRALAAMCGAGLVLAPYLAQNAAQFGHLVPISGAIKSTFPAFDFDVDKLGAMGKLAALSGAVSFALGAALDRDRRRRVLWLGLGIGTLLHALYVAGYTQHYTFWAWYYASGVIAAALAAAFLPGWLASRWPESRLLHRLLPVGLTIVILLASAARAHLKAFNPLQLGPVTVDWSINEYRWPEEFARRMKEELPADSIVFTYDWPGALAYYSGLRILPMDGLVNDFKFNDDLLAMGARAYLCQRQVGYFFGLIEDDLELQTLPVDAPLYRKSAGSLSLRSEDIVVRVRDVVARPDEALPFAIWRLRCGQAPQLQLEEHVENRRHGESLTEQERPEQQQQRDEDQQPEP